MSSINALVSWPAAPLTDSLVRKALDQLSLTISFVDKAQAKSVTPLLQWCTYDDMDHELMHFNRKTVLSSSYTFRKALIRKHFLSRIIHSYTTKNPTSILKNSVPRTFEIEISFADELDELWTDELWELGAELDNGKSWWILKPGMADRGSGIRVFHSKEGLQEIFEEFEEQSDEENEDGDGNTQRETSVVTSQLRHFVVQEYIDTPLLFDPTETTKQNPKIDELVGRKFHLRVYCVAKADIELYVYDRILALFSSVPYTSLSARDGGDEGADIDLRPHLTNTSLQTELGESNVRLLDELENCHIISGEENVKFTTSDIKSLRADVAEVLGDVFKAALQNPVHFQALPNAFELYGVDFVVSHEPSNPDKKLHVKLLEINAEPAIELTGPRLTWFLEDLFKRIGQVCVEPFIVHKEEGAKSWHVGETKYNFIKCLDENIRAMGSN
ncbi:putative tubulin--tyrosine ligase PBY1 [Psilocybe cubensis]|uniref:Tubulin--tyrosine ligase PBY1 n=2 Tax=Psilocybe cubensis TaxID=181762 RepID=A0ACB8HFI2_PSICU|nr:putative tubulin--tyrosine ligase PBY1 [Psilocybe cubensis]KAH9486775.1 putative tubulin--tyrosine ligase PBY1 [Psilocybe cubensis]